MNRANYHDLFHLTLGQLFQLQQYHTLCAPCLNILIMVAAVPDCVWCQENQIWGWSHQGAWCCLAWAHHSEVPTQLCLMRIPWLSDRSSSRVSLVSQDYTLSLLSSLWSLWWCPMIHWWSLVSLWPARLPAGASSHQSALTTTPALYLWSLPLVHCGKTRGEESSSHHDILNKSEKAYSFMNANAKYKEFEHGFLHV